ncbi:hypothetical protein [Cupriavidus gilardii]|uniref:hypothetical protein n=1 Tax=Cupriavidus gilardii TaxID=82541 RepID=UPI0030841859
MAALPIPSRGLAVPPAAVPANEVPSRSRDASPAPGVPIACAHCLALAADARRREPHERLALKHTAPLVSESAAGVPFSMLTFECRECGTTWRLYDRANELFVSWVPQWRPGALG